MANTIIQILRSYETETPSNLADGSLAYSFVSNTLFIGSETANGNTVYAIGGNSLVNLTQSAFDAANTKVSKSGDIMTGPLNFFGTDFGIGEYQYTGGIDFWANNNTSYAQINYGNTNFVYVDGSTAAIQSPNAFISADVTGNAAINLTGGAYGNVWTFTPDAKMHWPDGSVQNTGFMGSATDSYARDLANTKFNSSGGTISGSVNISNDLNVTGNLVVTGNVTTQNIQSFSVVDPLIVLGVGNYTSDNKDIGFASHYNAGTNAHTGLIRDSGTKDYYFFQGYTPILDANNNIDINDASFSKANAQASYFKGNLIANTVVVNGIDVRSVQDTQNNNITYVNQYAAGAYGKANAAFNFANNISSSLSGNSIVMGANTAGLLVSNAVTMTESTYITNGIAQMNQVLGKLVPASPPNFPGAYRAITINSLVGPYRMANFTQQDNSSNSRSVAGGTSTTVLRSSSYTTSSIINVGPGDSGTLNVYKDGVVAGTRTLVAGNGNAGTYNDLVILNNVDYSTITSAASGFWSSMNVRASGTVSNGWNEVYVSHTGVGDRTNTAYWYYDNSAPGTPTFASASIVPQTTSLTYSSTIPHYNSSTTFKLGVDCSKLSGDMFPASNTFFTGTAGGAFAAPASNTYPTVGITYPLARNLYVSSGSVTVNTTSTIVSGFGSSSTGPSVTVDNSYNTGSQAFTTALNATVLYKTGTASSMEETAVTFGSTVGTGSGSASRIINPGSTDTPAQSASASLFDSQTGTLQTYDATIVGAVLKHDQTNYATGYLPAGPNLSSGRTGAQYFTFRFVRTSVSKFDIQFTGTIAGLWVAVPGSAIDTAASATNGWVSMASAYGGAGVPSSGCALGGVVTLNSAVTNHRKTCTFGTVSSSDTATNEIYVRIKLTSGQTVTALSLQTASN